MSDVGAGRRRTADGSAAETETYECVRCGHRTYRIARSRPQHAPVCCKEPMFRTESEVFS